MPRNFLGYHAWRQALADGVTLIWQASAFYTASTPRIPERSRLRRGFVPRSPVTCRQEVNVSRRLDRRGDLLLRVVRVAGLCGVRAGVWMVGADRTATAGAAANEHLVRYRHSTDGGAVDQESRRCVSRVPGARLEVHSVAAEAFVNGARSPDDFCVLHRCYTACRTPVVCTGVPVTVHIGTDRTTLPGLRALAGAR